MRGNKDKYFALGSEALRSLSRFALGILVARWLGPDGYGVFVLLLTAEIVIHTLANSLWATPMASLAPGLAEPMRSGMMRVASKRQWHACAVAGASAALVAAIALGDSLNFLTLAGFGLSVALGGGLLGVRARVSASFRSREAAIADAVATFVPVAAVISAALLGGDVAATYWLSRALSQGAVALWIERALPLRRLGPAPDLAEFREMGRYMAIGSFANSVCTRVQPFVLAAVATSHQLGLFGAALSVMGPLRMGTAALSGVLRPRLALHFRGANPSQGWRTVALSLGIVSAFGVATCLIVALFGEWLGSLAFGERFTGLGPLLVWSSVYALLASANSIVVVVIQVVDSAARTAKLRILASAVSLATIGPLAILYGAQGAFGSLVLSEAFYFAAGMVLLARAKRSSMADEGKDPSVVDESHTGGSAAA